MGKFEEIKDSLRADPKKWLITGVAGFIGSNLLEALLKLDQKVVGLDNFCTGFRHNLEEVQGLVADDQWRNFEFMEGDIRDYDACLKASKGMDYILHQAAIGSVPRSINDPLFTNENNISGFLNMLEAARKNYISKFVYAASSSTYGDHPGLPKKEEIIGEPLSPYAVTKLVNELYAKTFRRVYDFSSIGLRYFNIFGPRQDPNGAYAAVIPLWFRALIRNEQVFINGDGETSRDFCFIDNCVQANILAAVSEASGVEDQVFNVAVGERTTLNELFYMIRSEVSKKMPHAADIEPVYRDFRAGDVRHSLADIAKSEKILGYRPLYNIKDGLAKSSDWYLNHL